MGTLVIIVATTLACYGILRQFGVFEISTRPAKVKGKIEDQRKVNRKRKIEQNRLKMYSTVVDMFRGILMNDIVLENHKYYIERLNIRSEALNRRYTPDELRGKHAFWLVVTIIPIPLAVFQPLLLLCPLVGIAYFSLYEMQYKLKIQDEDAIIDDYFIDLYLLLYSKLKQGSRARLQSTVENYMHTLETQASTEQRDTMLNLARYLLNLLSLYEDHVAIPMLRNAYHSATIINFCNVAAQSLNGISNDDNLLSFKMQLVERKTNLMRKRSQEILRKGERSIYLIWIILVIFVVVGWWSKLPTGFF